MPKFECDKCGACCRGHLIVEAYDIDVIREPRLIDADRVRAGMSLDEVLADLEDPTRCIILTCGSPCRFLGPDNLCTIYPTRPNDCVAMQAGDEQCQLAREQTGLPPLEPSVD